MLQVNAFEIVVLLAFSCEFLLILSTWQDFDTCYAPIQIFLLSSAFLTITFGLMLNLERLASLPRFLKRCGRLFFIYLLTPLSTYTGIQGLIWQLDNIHNTPFCTPSYTPLYQIWMWIIYQNFISLLLIGLLIMKAMDHWQVYITRRRMSRWADMTTDPMLRQFLLNNMKVEEECHGISPGEIDMILLKTYSASLFNSDESEQNTCSVCIEDMKEGEKVMVLPGCDHVYHFDCIKIWLVKEMYCPMCRSNVKESLQKMNNKCNYKRVSIDIS